MSLPLEMDAYNDNYYLQAEFHGQKTSFYQPNHSPPMVMVYSYVLVTQITQ